jgi:hypothetical protein
MLGHGCLSNETFKPLLARLVRGSATGVEPAVARALVARVLEHFDAVGHHVKARAHVQRGDPGPEGAGELDAFNAAPVEIGEPSVGIRICLNTADPPTGFPRRCRRGAAD